MSDVKISNLAENAAPKDTDIFLLEDPGVQTQKATFKVVKEAILEEHEAEISELQMKNNELNTNLLTPSTITYTQTTAISSSPTTVVDGNVLNWKLTGNTAVSGNALVGHKPTKIKSVGKNQFNLQDHIAWLTANGDGVNVTEENGETVVSFDNDDYATDRYSLTLKASTQYTFSFDAKVGADTGYLYIYYSDGTNSSVSFTNTTYTRKTITSTSGKTISSITWANSSTASKIYIKNIQMEEGTTATTYEPYKSSEVNITNGVELHKLDNGVTDILYSNGDKVLNMKKIVLTASDITGINTAAFTTVDAIFVAKKSDWYLYNNATQSLANAQAVKIPSFTAAAVAAENYQNRVFNRDATTIGLLVAKGTYATLAAAQTALAGTEIIYQLANAVKSNLIDELAMSGQLQSYVGGTIFVESSTSSIGTLTATIPTNKAAQGNSTIYAIRNLAKSISTLATKVLGKIDRVSIVNNFTVTDPNLGLVANAATVKVLKDGQDEINTNLVVNTEVVSVATTQTGVSGTTLTFSTYTIPKSGFYEFSGNITFAPNASGVRQVALEISTKQSITSQQHASSGTYNLIIPIRFFGYLTSGTTVALKALTLGNSANINVTSAYKGFSS